MTKFTYSNLKQSILDLKPEISDYFLLGHSFLGEPVWGFHIGPYTGRQILVEAGIHAREYITSLALIKEIKHLKKLESALEFGTYFIPLLNPDGARLVIDGPEFIANPNLKRFLRHINNGSLDFSLWKANALGVDLNSNFNALWGLGAENKFLPSPAGFVGFYPNSEIENINLLKFVADHPLSASLSIHTKGEVVLFGYDGLTPAELARDEAIATHLARHLGFTPEKTYKSVGGFSDYMSDVYHVPAFTIELANERLPHPVSPIYLEQVASPIIGIVEQLYLAIKKLGI